MGSIDYGNESHVAAGAAADPEKNEQKQNVPNNETTMASDLSQRSEEDEAPLVNYKSLSWWYVPSP